MSTQIEFIHTPTRSRIAPTNPLIITISKCTDKSNYRVGGDVEEARAAAAAIAVAPAEEVFLSVTRNLSWSAALDVVSRDSSPVSPSNLGQSKEE